MLMDYFFFESVFCRLVGIYYKFIKEVLWLDSFRRNVLLIRFSNKYNNIGIFKLLYPAQWITEILKYC